MAVSVADLIKRKEAREASKKARYDIKTSMGVFTIRKPSRAIFIESRDMENGDGDRYVILNSVVEPNLKDAKLQEVYECTEPTDIIDKLFDPGEVVSIAKAIMEVCGYGKDIPKKVHEDLKN